MSDQVHCETCDELMSTNASKCPHCQSKVVTKPIAYIVLVVGVLLPVAYTSGTEALAHSGFLQGVYIGIALAPFIVLLLGVGFYQQRQEQLASGQ